MNISATGSPTLLSRQLGFGLYNGRNAIQAIGGEVTANQTIRGFAIWKNGSRGSPIIFNSQSLIKGADKNRFSLHMRLPYNMAKVVNQVDRWTFTWEGDDYIINISDANILREYTRTNFLVDSPNTIFSEFPQGSLISAEVENMLSVTLLTPPVNPLYDIFWTEITGLDSTDVPRLPIIMDSTSNLFTFDGDLHATNLQKVRYAIGRTFGFASLRITLQVLPFIPIILPPPPPPEITTYTMLITNIRLVGDLLKGYLSIDPALPVDHPQAVQVVYQQTAPDRLLTVRKTIEYDGDGDYDLFNILEGEHYTFYWRTTFRNPGRLISSPRYNYMRMGGEIITDPTVSQEAELSDSKIYLDRLGATSLSLLLINDLFNTDDISKVVIGITDSNGTSIQEKDNTVFDARIEINITGLSQETDYSLEVSIVYNEVAKTIATLKVTTLKSLSTNSSDAEKQAYSRKNFTRRNYDKEDVDLIENLPIDQWNAVVTNAIQQINNAESDQLPHDLNRFNRRGSVHNTPRSPSPTGNFVGSLDVRIAEESGAIPDIDEGYA